MLTQRVELIIQITMRFDRIPYAVCPSDVGTSKSTYSPRPSASKMSGLGNVLLFELRPAVACAKPKLKDIHASTLGLPRACIYYVKPMYETLLVQVVVTWELGKIKITTKIST